MSNYQLIVLVNPADIATLKAAGYKLCVARKVNNAYNVIWSGTDFFYQNVFGWSSQFQVFGTQTFADGALVQSSTQAFNIGSGETALLDSSGVMHNPGGTKDQSGTFHVDNEYGAMNIGVNGYMNGTYGPIYVSPHKLVTGTIDLTPIEKLMVWFDSTHVTGTMITTSISNSIEIDFTAVPSRSATYASDPSHPGLGGWIMNNQFTLSATYEPLTNRFNVERPSPRLLAKVASVIAAQSSGASSVSVKAIAEFEDSADKFAQYLQGKKPQSLSTWDVSSTTSLVEVLLSPVDTTLDVSAGTKVCRDAFLGVADAFQGTWYQKLTIEVVHSKNSTSALFSADATIPAPVPLAQAPLSAAKTDPRSTGHAIFRFTTMPDAIQYANDASKKSGGGVTWSGEAAGAAALLQLAADPASADVAMDRLKVTNSLDAAKKAINADKKWSQKVTFMSDIDWEQAQ